MVYLNLNKQYLEKTKEKANKLAISEMGDDCKDLLMWDLNDKEVVIDQIEEDGTIDAHSDSDIGYVSFKVKLTDDDLIAIITIMNKRMNKFKNVLESLK